MKFELRHSSMGEAELIAAAAQVDGPVKVGPPASASASAFGAAAPPAPGSFCPAAVAGSIGRAVQVEPIEPTFKAPGTKRLKL